MTGSLRMTVLATVCNAQEPLPATEIGYLIPGTSARRVRSYLTMLYRDGLIERRRQKLGSGLGGWKYVYYGSSQQRSSNSDPGWNPQQAQDFGRAIARARPHWRKGELFSRQEVARFRREQKRRVDYVLGR